MYCDWFSKPVSILPFPVPQCNSVLANDQPSCLTFPAHPLFALYTTCEACLLCAVICSPLRWMRTWRSTAQSARNIDEFLKYIGLYSVILSKYMHKNNRKRHVCHTKILPLKCLIFLWSYQYEKWSFIERCTFIHVLQILLKYFFNLVTTHHGSKRYHLKLIISYKNTSFYVCRTVLHIPRFLSRT